MVCIKKDLDSASDLRDYLVENGWSIYDEIAKIDEVDAWDIIFDMLDYDENGDLSLTELNDFIRFEALDLLVESGLLNEDYDVIED